MTRLHENVRCLGMSVPVFCLCTLFTACASGEAGDAATQQKKAVAERPLAVKVTGLHRGAISQRLGFVGELAAEESVEVAAKLSGRIRSIRVRMGDAVEKGALLADIEDTELRAKLKEARALLAVSKAAISRAEILEKNAAAEVARKAPLLKKDLVTPQEMDNLRSKQASEAANLALARADASKAEAGIQLLSSQLKDTKIRAPFKGRVAARYLDPGAVVSPGTAILQLIDADPVIARFKVPERYLGVLVRADTEPLEVSVRLDAFPDETFTGRVARVSPVLDKTTRTAVVEAEMQNPDGRIAPGMYCRVTLDLGRKDGVLLLPAAALLEASGKTVTDDSTGTPTEGNVYVIDARRAHRKKVLLGAESDGYYAILDGLDERARVVVDGASLLKEGAKVTVLGSDTKTPAENAAGAGK